MATSRTQLFRKRVRVQLACGKDYVADVVVNVVKQEWHTLVAAWQH